MGKTCIDKSGLKAIDLGLRSGTKWSDKNIGANSPEERGEYYAWGETEEKSEFTFDSYKHCDKQSGLCHALGACICGSDYDVAHTQWGEGWQMPTLKQIKELLDSCTSEWTCLNGVSGIKFTGPNGNSIFLPAAGYNYDFDIHNLGSHGYYWCGTMENNEEGIGADAYSLEFGTDTLAEVFHSRYLGLSVRPVFVG